MQTWDERIADLRKCWHTLRPYFEKPRDTIEVQRRASEILRARKCSPAHALESARIYEAGTISFSGDSSKYKAKRRPTSPQGSA